MTAVFVSCTGEVEARVRAVAGDAPVEFVDVAADISSPPDQVEAIVNVVEPLEFHLFPRLDWVHTATAGVDGFDIGSLNSRGVTVTSAAGNGGVALAEHSMMLMMMLNRDCTRWIRAQQERSWDRFLHGELAGRTVVVIGMGAAGKELARRAAAFDMTVVGVTRSPHDSIPYVTRLETSDRLASVVADADFLVVAAPATPATAGLVDATVLDSLPAHAFVICVSRGGIIDEDALVSRLSDGRLAGAGLDAHRVEPLPVDSPLWLMPNVIVTPHNGATSDGTVRRGIEILVDNATRYFSGEKLRNIVDAGKGY
ncbi:hypothetical protein CH293_06100 [Rhodococcus sp. 14-2470-1b]|uniref:D-2-hydroxyacid dehydrogenase n=1 Tax=Rhodococcus sp. 14-2470-1b TaxID=2023149 RepID=UPI000B9B3014|nr:D-2-hydroxyacid dehydrogenase [Rhodococcus sp. 14-2470-1b]OZF55556.1 hypothetical protein CH293_06100 [Rhodococcus sp. 14-2470-1b]